MNNEKNSFFFKTDLFSIQHTYSREAPLSFFFRLVSKRYSAISFKVLYILKS